MKPFILVLLLLSFQVLAVSPVQERQEINLAKAELALLDGNNKLAYKLLKKNLSKKHFHFPSFIFLADFYIEQGKWSRAVKVYHFIIKHLHDPSVIKLRYAGNISEYISHLPAPNPRTMEVYFRLANLYKSLHSAGRFDKEYKKKLLSLARKYFEICDYYKFNLPVVKYQLGLIKAKQSDTNEAIFDLIAAKDLMLEEGDEDAKDVINQVNFSLAESLIRDGHTDAGTLYLKNLYLGQDIPDSLREYARSFLDSLSFTFFSIGLSSSLNYSSNINQLTDEELVNFDPTTNISEDGFTTTRNVNAFYATPKWKSFSANLVLNYLEDKANNRDLATNDLRNISFISEVKYDNLVHSIMKFAYTFSQTYLRSDTTSPLEKSITAHGFSVKYIHTLKSGTISYKIPYTMNQSTSETTIDYGLEVGYIPFWQSRYISLSYSLALESTGEGEDEENSTNFSASVSNHFNIKPQLSYFVTVEYENNSNTDPSNSYSETSIENSLTYSFKRISGLSTEFTLEKSSKDEGEGGHISEWASSLGLSYSF
jgi:hypothetical protein